MFFIKFLFTVLILSGALGKIFSNPSRTYKIIVDPGHGGIEQTPYEDYGDKFDTISNRYLEPYKGGAKYKNETERDIVLNIAKEVKKVLDLTHTEKGFKKFRSYVKLFSDQDPEWIRIDSVMTRTDSYTDRKFREKDDKNASYRLYDFPEYGTGKMQKGRISFINSEAPVMTVSLHINDQGGGSNVKNRGGMGVVLAPSYNIFEEIRQISEGKTSKDHFLSGPWKNWVISHGDWSRLENAMADAWIYFHGYWPTQNGKATDILRFEGYRQNMVTWKYKDDAGWENRVFSEKKGPYAMEHKNFIAKGRFWEREKSKYESFRREDGLEIYGGDNHYAGMELLRFIQYGLRLQTDEKTDRFTEPAKIVHPYISTYSLPTLINSISAYLELGEIRSDRDIYFLKHKKKKMSVCIAVGIYSLLNGLEVRSKQDFPYIPKGKKLDLGKYITEKGTYYFMEAR